MILFALMSLAFAAEYQPMPGSGYESAPEYQGILAQVKLLGSFDEKKMPEPIVKTMGRGQQAVEAAKARNRDILKHKSEEDRKIEESQKGLTQEQIWREEVRRTHDSWKKEIIETRKQWQREQDIFLGRIKEYKAAAFEIPAPQERIVEKTVARLPEVSVIGGAFQVPIKDQAGRATCAAFAAIRAVEIILAQNKVEKDLSEQYFYWASKPQCQKGPCNKRGSWVLEGFKLSQKSPVADIPLELNCSYDPTIKADNETQAPLKSGCLEGVGQIKAFEDVRTLADVVEKIKSNTPVIISTKLSTNFYLNQGLVTLKESKTQGKTDAHALGHAYVVVGVLELPEAAHASEGKFCLLAANSWGKGWGVGGYSCLTENWLKEFRSSAPFVAVTKISYAP